MDRRLIEFVQNMGVRLSEAEINKRYKNKDKNIVREVKKAKNILGIK